jgi:hypothetical protein
MVGFKEVVIARKLEESFCCPRPIRSNTLGFWQFSEPVLKCLDVWAEEGSVEVVPITDDMACFTRFNKLGFKEAVDSVELLRSKPRLLKKFSRSLDRLNLVSRVRTRVAL